MTALTTNLDHQLEQAPELRKLACEVILAEGLRDLTMAQRRSQSSAAIIPPKLISPKKDTLATSAIQ